VPFQLYIVQGSAEREEMLREVLGFTAKVAELKRSQAGYRTRKGKTIHFVSALLLELMQNCAYGVRDMLESTDVTEMMEMDGDAAESKPATKLVGELCPCVRIDLTFERYRTRRRSRHTWTRWTGRRSSFCSTC